MRVVSEPQEYPGGDGAGIIIVGGGAYLAGAYIAMRHIRHHGCKLPIELWHLGPVEIPSFWTPLSEPLGVSCIDAFQIRGAQEFARLGGWECKVHAITSCRFEKVLLIDADNVPLLDPSLIFGSEQFLRYGQVFWPDFYYEPEHRYAIRPLAWKELGIAPASGLELESGQIAVNRRTCWEQLQVARALNLRSPDSYGRFTWGDKDTFTLAWLATRRPYCTIPIRPQYISPQRPAVFWQHWFDGRKLFQHQRKWLQPPPKARKSLETGELLVEKSLEYLKEFWNAAKKISWAPATQRSGYSTSHLGATRAAPAQRLQLTSVEEIRLFHHQGRLSEAIAACTGLISLRPEEPALWHLQGLIAADLRDPHLELQSFTKAVELNPTNVTYRLDLAAALNRQQHGAQALPHLMQALRLSGGRPEVHNALGNVLEKMSRFSEAAASYQNALRLRDEDIEARHRLAVAQRKSGDPAASIQTLEVAMQRTPDSLAGLSEMAAAAAEIGDLSRSLSCLRRLANLQPGFAGARSALLYTLHYDPGMDPPALYREHLEWDRRFVQPVRHLRKPHANARNCNERIRVGYVSPDFREHTVPRFIGAALQHHDRRRFEIFCYSDVADPDATTRQLRRQVEHWRDLVGLPDWKAEQIIRDDRIDILVDLRGHAADNRLTLFALKPAPIQVNMVGYFDTTGLSTMDYRLTDSLQDPPNVAEHFHCEQLIRLPRSCWCYTPDENAPQVTAPPAVQNGFVTFGSLNKIIKLTEPAVRQWADVLGAVPGSKLLLSTSSARAAEAVQQRLEFFGLSPSRLVFANRTATRRQYLEQFNKFDIALDTFPFNGITTTCDGLWMGVPCVSLAGATTVSRAGRSILHAADLSSLATDSPGAFVAAAADLAADVVRLQELRLTMRQRLCGSALLDHEGFTRALEAEYERIWRRWTTVN